MELEGPNPHQAGTHGDETRRRRSRLGRSTLFHVIAQAAMAGGPFAVLLVLVTQLDSHVYGAIGIYQFCVHIAIPLVGGSLHGAVGRDVFDRGDDAVRRATGASVGLIVSLTCLAAGITLTFSGWIPSELGLNAELVLLAILTAAARAITFLRVTTFQMRGRAGAVAGWQITHAALFIVGCLVGVAVLGGVRGFAIGQSIVVGGMSLLALLFLARERGLSLRLDPQACREVLRFAAPLVPHVFALTVIPLVGRTIVADVCGLDVSGSYTLSQQFAMLVFFVGTAIHQAWVPWLFDQRSRDGARVTASADERDTASIERGLRYVRNAIGGLFLLAVAIGFVAPWFSEWIAADYPAAGRVTLWLALGYFAQTAYSFESARLFFHRRTGVVATATTVTAFVHLPATYLAARLVGPDGAAFVTMLAFCTLFLRVRALADREDRRSRSEVRALSTVGPS